MASARNIIAEQVRQGRTRKKWTRARLAEEVQVTSDEIANIEMSATDTAPALLQRLVAALGLDGKALNEQLRAATPREEAVADTPVASASPPTSTTNGASAPAAAETAAPASAPTRRPGRSSAQAAAQTTTSPVPVPVPP